VVADSRGQSHARAARRLNEPRPALVTAVDGVPTAIDHTAVELVREEWRVLERWWTEYPLRRRYFDVVLATGENVVVFHDETGGTWHRQRA
jgi:hypothetical protein